MGLPKLKPQFLKCLLSLNGDIPDENSMIWITLDEMRDRLVEGGVDRSLTTDILQSAVTLHNRGERYLSRRPHDNIKYYRPSKYQYCDGTPDDQRSTGGGRKQMNRNLPIHPPKNYFLSALAIPATNFKVKMLNDALIEYENKLADEESEYILPAVLYICCACILVYTHISSYCIYYVIRDKCCIETYSTGTRSNTNQSN